jgi:NUDIX domain.
MEGNQKKGGAFLDLETLLEKFRDRDRFPDSRMFNIHYSVLVPIMEREGKLHLIFEVRSKNLKNQPGEICFPGGKVEWGETPKEAALRETCEELGLQREDLLDIERMGEDVQPFAFRIIHTFVGVIQPRAEIRPNPDEVEEIFAVPLEWFRSARPEIYQVKIQLLPEQVFPSHKIPGGENRFLSERKIKEYFYYYGDYTIWGLTARILQDFLARAGISGMIEM